MLYVLPQDGPAPIVRFIENARGPLVINNYFLDSRPILAAISDAVRRGVGVEVILEPRPYMISRYMVQKEYREVAATGAKVVSAPSRFATGRTFDHAKYAVSANGVLIGTANWDWSGMHKNREYIYVSHNPMLVKAMQKVALADINGRPANIPLGDPAALVLSPGPRNGVYDAMASLIQQPGPVGIETEELQPDNPMMQVMEQKGSQLSIILPDKLSSREDEAVSELRHAGVHVVTLKSPYMHAKMIVGTKAGFIGSQNFSITSINYNREVGVIMSGRENMQILDQEFSADYSAAVNGSAAPGGYSGYHAYHSYGNTTSNGGGVVGHVMGNIASHFLRHKILGNW